MSLYPAPQVGATGSVCSDSRWIDGVREQIRVLDPDLEPGSARFRCAVLLVAAAAVGQNIDRLARRTGYDREFVAIRARRWFDSGVWKGGASMAPAWSQQPGARPRLRFAIDAAEGALRRRTAQNGSSEWVRVGRGCRTIRRKTAFFVAHLTPRFCSNPHPPKGNGTRATPQGNGTRVTPQPGGRTHIGPVPSAARWIRQPDSGSVQEPLPEEVLGSGEGEVVWLGCQPLP
jgi:hypothetical protein